MGGRIVNRWLKFKVAVLIIKAQTMKGPLDVMKRPALPGRGGEFGLRRTLGPVL